MENVIIRLSNQVKHKPVVSAEERSAKQKNRSKEITQNIAQRDKEEKYEREVEITELK